MTIANIPTGILPEVVVETLPSVGEENTIYRRLVENELMREWGMTDDFIWYDGEYHSFSFDAKIFGAYFARYQNSVNAVVSDLEKRIQALESGMKGILYEADDVSLIESMATIGVTIDVITDLVISHGTSVKITLTNMTVDSVPIDDVEDTITLYKLTDWDWQGGDLYSDVFGDGAYFAFGTKPMDSVATKVTLGFVNENEISHSRTLVIGHIKVEVI